MAGDEVRVDTTDLRAKAIQIGELHLIKAMSGFVSPIAPDAVALSKAAVDNLLQNARFLVQNQLCGSQEGDRLAESLESVAKAYDDVDAAAQASLDGTGPPPQPVMPAGNKIAPLTPPAPMGAPGAVNPDEIGDVELAQSLLSAGDHGESLQTAAGQWEANGTMLREAAQKFRVRIQDWEGEAADQAYAKFGEFGQWLSALGDTWHQLAGEARRIADAHVKALLEHTPVFQRYQELKREWMVAASRDGAAAHHIAQQMEPLHRQSENIIDGYAGEAAPHAVAVATPPPSSGVPAVPVTSHGDSRRRTDPGAGKPSAGGAASSSGAGPTSPTGAPGAPAVSPVSAETAAGGPPSGEESGAGGSPTGGGGGSPSGGGSPAAGTPSLPGGGPPTDLPTVADDPGVRPAAADVGGGSGGGAGGGSGGGVGAMPLQPSVGGVAVGPGPAGGAGAGVGSPGGTGPGGAAGGMGGMPMGGHGQGQGGTNEKRRAPGVAPDEDVYTEERPWTEAVIGNRRRKDVPDPKTST